MSGDCDRDDNACGDMMSGEDPIPISDRCSLEKTTANLEDVLESTAAYYGSIAELYVYFYDEYLPNHATPEYRRGYEKVAELLKEQMRAGELILDLGCGIGYWTTLMASQGAKVTAVDPIPEMLEKCRERLERLGLMECVELHQCGASSLPFSDQHFDGVVLNWLLAHIPPNQGQELIPRLAGLVREGGWILVSDSYWRGQEGGKEQVQTREAPDGVFKIYKYYYELEELKTLLERSFGKVKLLEATTYEMIAVATKRQTV